MKNSTYLILAIIGLVIILTGYFLTYDQDKELLKEKLPQVQDPVQEPPKYICDHNTYNCGDLVTKSRAKEVFDYCMSLGYGDIHLLDADEDGIPCELNSIEESEK